MPSERLILAIQEGTVNPNVLEIIEAWLREHGYDGLVRLEDDAEDDCGCGLDHFAPCGGIDSGGMTHRCQAAYRHADGLFYLDREASNDDATE